MSDHRIAQQLCLGKSYNFYQQISGTFCQAIKILLYL